MPNSVSSRTAWGRRLMPTPSSLTSDAASYTSTSVKPAAWRDSASDSPPIPPPQITTRSLDATPPVCSHAGDDVREGALDRLGDPHGGWTEDHDEHRRHHAEQRR